MLKLFGKYVNPCFSTIEKRREKKQEDLLGDMFITINKSQFFSIQNLLRYQVDPAIGVYRTNARLTFIIPAGKQFVTKPASALFKLTYVDPGLTTYPIMSHQV